MQESVTSDYIVGNRVPLLAELNDPRGLVGDGVTVSQSVKLSKCQRVGER